MNTENILEEVGQLVARRYTLEMATVSKSGTPHASYAPYICGDNFKLYVFISSLAMHTHNIAENNNVSVMIIEDETQNNLFVRERFTLHCKARFIERSTEEFKNYIDLYKNRFGAIVDTLVRLADFGMYELNPESGVYVKGFGQAYRIDGADMSVVEHIRNPAQEAAQRKPQMEGDS